MDSEYSVRRQHACIQVAADVGLSAGSDAAPACQLLCYQRIWLVTKSKKEKILKQQDYEYRRRDTINYYSYELLKRFGKAYLYSDNPLFQDYIPQHRFIPYRSGLCGILPEKPQPDYVTPAPDNRPSNVFYHYILSSR